MPRDASLVLIACCLAMLSVGENSTAIMAALPEMTRSLELGPATVEWAVNAYLLASAIFIILGGEAADQFGPRRSSAGGIALFALASMMIALAPNGAVVIGARALQGFGAAFAVAGTLAAVTEAAPEAKRAGAIGAWTGFPDAGLQHRAARGRRLDALCGMASGVLAERCGDGAGGAGAVAESRHRGHERPSRWTGWDSASSPCSW